MSDVTEQEREPLVARPEDRLGATDVPAAPSAPAADTPFTDEMSVFPGGQRRVPMTERPFLRLVKAYTPKFVNKDDRVVEAQATLNSLYDDRDQAASEDAQRVYDDAMQAAQQRVEKATTAFQTAKTDARDMRSKVKAVRDAVYSEVLDDNIEHERERLEAAVSDARTKLTDITKAAKAEATKATSGETPDFGGDQAALVAHFKKQRQAAEEARTGEFRAGKEAEQALEAAEVALAEFDHAHAADLKIAKEAADIAAAQEKQRLTSTKSAASEELAEAKKGLVQADKDARAAAEQTSQATADRFNDQIEDAELAVDTAKQTVTDEITNERDAALDAYKDKGPGPMRLAMAKFGELATKAAIGVKGILPGAIQGAIDYAASYQSDRTSAARATAVLEDTSSEVINQLGNFDRHTAADIQGKMLALAKVDESADLNAISSYAELHDALRDSGVTQHDLAEAGRDLDKGKLAFGVPGTGQIAAKFGLVNANSVDAMITAQAGKQLINIAGEISNYAKDPSVDFSAAEIIDLLRHEEQPGLATADPAAPEVADSRYAAQGALKLGQLVDGLVAIDPQLTKSLGFTEVKKDLAGLGKTALNEAESNLRVTNDPVARTIGQVNKRTKGAEADAGSVTRISDFIDQSIRKLEQAGRVEPEQAAQFRAMAAPNLKAANQVFVARQERADMRNLRVPTPPQAGVNA